jgi:hypothetical protein
LLKAKEITERIKNIDVPVNETAKFTKFLQYLYGQKDFGRGMVIVTAMNPHGDEISWRENEERWDKFLVDVKSLGKHYIIQSGTYNGIYERSVLIVDISKPVGVALGKRWDQESVIVISKEEDGSLTFDYFEHGAVRYTRHGITTGAEIEKQIDDYSRMGSKPRYNRPEYEKGRKYQIPFFSSEGE